MMREQLETIYRTLHEAYGPQGWWPAEHATEVIIGAVLVQHTTWRAAERAIAQLRAAHALDFAQLARISEAVVVELVRPAGMPRVKARRLRSVARWFNAQSDDGVMPLGERPLADLREQLLNVDGIGPETADCILLYALGRPSFVVDTYARRVLVRHGVISATVSSGDIKALIERSLPPDVEQFNEYHALLVAVGQDHCRRQARCAGCPLEHLPHHDGPV